MLARAEAAFRRQAARDMRAMAQQQPQIARELLEMADDLETEIRRRRADQREAAANEG